MTCRWRARLVLFAVVVTAAAAPAFAKDKPKPSLTVEPIGARDLLALAQPDWKLSIVEGERQDASRSYRLTGTDDLAAGQRARLSVELGDTIVFAMAGRLKDRSQQGPLLDATQASALGPRKSSGSKIYGGGLERRFGPVEVSATYQYSRVSSERSESNLPLDNPKSHNVRATARIRFAP